MTSRSGILLIAAFALVAAETPKLPDTPAGQRLGGMLEAVNTRDPETIRQHFQKAYPTAPNKGDKAIELSRATGGLDLVKVLDAAPDKIVVLVKERNAERFARLTMNIVGAEPHHIKSIQLVPAQRPPELAPPRLDEAGAIAALRAEAERQAAAGRFSGAILVSKNGKPLYGAALGMADREAKIANRLDTRFRIGSMNKMFTAVAALQLVQRGKLNLQDTIGKHLIAYPNQDVAAKVTIHHLLTHTGGTGDIFGPQFDDKRLQLKTLQDYVVLYGSRGLEFEPGSRFGYSNYGFLLLGVIIEKVTGQSYYDYVEQSIFKPAGMTRTASLAESEKVAGRSKGYMREGPDQPWIPNTDTLPYRGTSAGGGYSTVEDLDRFAQALLSHKLLDAKHTGLLTSGKVDARGGKYAYGFSDSRTYDGVRWFGHGGGAPGMNGDLCVLPNSGYVIAVLANLDPPSAGVLSEFVLDRLPLEAPVPVRQSSR